MLKLEIFTMRYIVTFLLFHASFCLCAQTLVEGYVFEENNRGYLNQVKVSAFSLPDNALVQSTETNTEGLFKMTLPPGRYRLLCKKDVFADKNDTVEVVDKKVFAKIEMRRRPGYLFDATLAERRDNADIIVDAIENSRIEIYNRTAKRNELVLEKHPNAFFQFTFNQGNHYTILIRKEGFLAKRIEAYVNVKGCIICVDGVKELSPGLTENLTADNTMGTLLANIELERARLNKRIVIENIYYDYDKADIRPDAAKELDKIVTLMRDNPGMTVELGSHTDARGNNQYNLNLSQRRAESAVAYIVEHGVDKSRIVAKGYGETTPVNKCRDGITCTDDEHQRNRRTELRITGLNADGNTLKTLEDIVREEDFDRTLRELETQQVYRTPGGAAPTAEPSPAPKTQASPETNKPQTTTARPVNKPQTTTTNTPPPTNKTQTPAVTPSNSNTIKIPPSPPARIDKTPQSPKQEKGSGGVIEDITPQPAPTLNRVSQILPAQTTGYLVEFVRVDNALPEGSALMNTFKNTVYRQQDKAGKYCYYTGLFTKLEEAKTYWREEVLPKFPQAKLVEFYRGEKVYLK
jgi:outer membrane protein OmpA-like peptidoglycan-associated protein